MTDRLADAERREARDSWRRTGGSARRPLKSFLTAEEKKARRLEHAERISAAVEYVRTDRGFTDWLEAREMNPRFSALNAALIAFQAPGEIADTAAGWKRQGCPINRGEHAAGYVTGPNFWPLAIFTADQCGAGELAELAELERPGELADTDRARVRKVLEDALAAGAKGRDALEAAAEAVGA
jgi:hypothetical protein